MFVFTNLRQSTYQDESGAQWRMSFFQVSRNMVKIYRLYQAQYVNESRCRENVIRLSETQLREIVGECIRKVLS